MSDRVLETKRLKLRALAKTDAADIARGIGDWDVIQWLTSPPYPYALEDAHSYLARDHDGPLAIELGGNFVGVVGLHDPADDRLAELGYWLARPYWGQGIMTEAASAVVAAHFNRSDMSVVSGYLLGNGRSNAVLAKLGFVDTEIIQQFSHPWGKERPCQRMELSAKTWQANANAPG